MARTLSELGKQVAQCCAGGGPADGAAFRGDRGVGAGLSEAETLASLRELKSGEHRIIRQISAIFDTRALGYRSSLVAARIDPARCGRGGGDHQWPSGRIA